MSQLYECEACEATGHLDTADGVVACEPCDGVGVTHIDCPGCGMAGVPIHGTVFVAATGVTYCESCGDRELERIAARRGRGKW